MKLEALASKRITGLIAENCHKENNHILDHFPTCLYYVLSTFGDTSIEYGSVIGVNSPTFVSMLQCQCDMLTDIFWGCLYGKREVYQNVLKRYSATMLLQGVSVTKYGMETQHFCSYHFAHHNSLSQYCFGTHETMKSKMSLQHLAQFEIMKCIICNIRKHPTIPRKTRHMSYSSWKWQVIEKWIQLYQENVKKLGLPTTIYENVVTNEIFYYSHCGTYYFPFWIDDPHMYNHGVIHD